MLRPEFLVAWGVVVGAVAVAVLSSRPRALRWPAAATAVAAVIFANGLSYYMWDDAKAYTLIVGPLALVAVATIIMDRVARGRRPVLAAAATVAAFAGVLVAVACAKATWPLAPIDGHFRPDPARVAMLAGRPNVVIITLDTTRADHTSLCGYKYPTTPNLEKLAADSVFFPYGETVDSWTLASHASMFTGKYPREHGARGDTVTRSESIERSTLYGSPLAPSQLTLATYLSMKGYNTAGFAANYSWLCRQFGLGQGFAYWHDMPRFFTMTKGGSPLFTRGAELFDSAMGWNGKFNQSYWDARSVTRFAQGWVRDNKGSPFFLFLNYMDAHEPYAPPPPFDHVDGADVPYSEMISRHPSWQRFYDRYIMKGEGLTPEIARQVSNQYDGEIAYEDHWVGRLMDSLKAEGVYDDTLIIVTADHGEFLGEHQLLNHGTAVYEGGIRIPILVKYPRGERAGEVVKSRVSIVDVFATVFDALKLPCPDVTGEPLGRATHPILAEEGAKGSNVNRYGKRFDRDLLAIFDGDLKYIRSTGGRPELYDLAADPGETKDLSGERPDVAARLDREISAWLEKTPLFDGSKEANKTISPDMRRKLESLGYLGSGADAR